MAKIPNEFLRADAESGPIVPSKLKWLLRRPIVRMPVPFCSISESIGGVQKASAARLLNTNKNAGSKDEKSEERILISEVDIVGVEGDLKQTALSMLKTRANFAYTIGEVKQDVRRVFNTGWFRECIPDAQDTRDGVRLVIKVTPNDEVRGMTTNGAIVLPESVVHGAFKGMLGKTFNFVHFKEAIGKLDGWYSEHGVLGQVVDFGVSDGIIRVDCAEVVVGRIALNFIDPKTQKPREKPRTRPEIILRHLTTKSGSVYSLAQAKRDVASIYSTGLFEDVNFAPKEAEDSTETCPRIDLDINLLERKTGGMGAGGGLSAAAAGEGGFPGLVGSFSYSEKNLFGLNQRLSARVELGQVDKTFQVVHTDPWLWGDPHRTSRTISFMNNRSSAAITHAREDSGPAGAGASSGMGSDCVLLNRLTGGVEFQRPLSARWSGSLGILAQRTVCINEHGAKLTQDCYGLPLTVRGRPEESLVMASLSTSYSNPDIDAHLLASVEQAFPARPEWLKFTRVRLRVSRPVHMGPLSLHLKARGGHVWGDLPPYEAFPIGGTNSVRGYAEGSVGSGRSWMEGSTELRFPIPALPLGGTLFFDYGTDLGSGATVIGNPGGARGKPGSGLGYGAGIRLDTPVGPLRLEYAWNRQRVGRFHVGVGND